MPISATALVILDMISDFDFPDGPAVPRGARRIAPRIAALKARCNRAQVPVIYVNDNIGRWRCDLRALVQHCQRRSAVVHDVVQQIIPEPTDFFVLKPRHSGFYATPLAALLEQAQARTVILTGVTSDQCVLFTANDAHLRELKVVIPSDCVASATAGKARFALKYFASVLGAEVRPSARLRF